VKIALVDVDGTLVDGQTYRPLTRLLWARPHLRPLIVLLFFQLMPGHLRRNRSAEDRIASQNGWTRGYTRLLAGMTLEEVAEIMKDACEDLVPVIRPEILREMAIRRAEGCAVTLASGSMMPFLDQLGPMVGAAGWVGTPVEIRDDRYTGRLDGPPCSGVAKPMYAEALLKVAADGIDWEASWAYGDSLSDLPMLERVGHPVAVAPEPGLAAEAVRRGWRVLEMAGNEVPGQNT
jgi:HAD superfamily hydrolase (TIGR01490 family)